MATDYEKLYKDALGRAEAIASKGPASAKFMSEIFPEFDKFNDERIRKKICLCIEECLHSDVIRDYERDELITYLEKQKEKKPAEWSEEDRNTLLMAATVLKANFDSDEKFDECEYDCETLAGKLLEMRHRPSSSWKPSEEQMVALFDIIHPADTVNRSALESLYEQLKKL